MASKWFEDVLPIENVDVPACHVSELGGVPSRKQILATEFPMSLFLVNSIKMAEDPKRGSVGSLESKVGSLNLRAWVLFPCGCFRKWWVFPRNHPF